MDANFAENYKTIQGMGRNYVVPNLSSFRDILLTNFKKPKFSKGHNSEK